MYSCSNINLKNISVFNNTLGGMHLVSCSNATLTSIYITTPSQHYPMICYINVTNHWHSGIILRWCSSMSLKDIYICNLATAPWMEYM